MKDILSFLILSFLISHFFKMSLTTTPVSPFLATEGYAGMVYASTECTVAQAAEFLDVSEGFVNELLKSEQILFRLENGEHKIEWSSLRVYRQKRERRNADAVKLFHFFQEMGLSDDDND